MSLIRNAAIFLVGLTLFSCVDNFAVEDNPSSGPTVELNEHNNIVEDTYFTDYVDLTTYAGDDFYEYAVGKWLEEHPLKSRERMNGTFPELMALCEKFIDELYKKTDQDEIIKRLQDDLAHSTMEEDAKLVKQKLAAVDAITTKEAMYQKMGDLLLEGYQMPGALSGIVVNRKFYAALDFYDYDSEYEIQDETLEEFLDEADCKKAREIVADYAKILVDNEMVSGSEIEIPRHLRQEHFVFIHPARHRAAGSSSPLMQILARAGLSETDLTMVADKGYTAVGNFIANLSVDDLKLFVKFMIVHRERTYYDAELSKSDAGGMGKLAIDKFSPMHLRFSALFNKLIPDGNQQAAIQVAENVRDAFRERIKKLTWMTDETKAKAIEKLDAMIFYIGWPVGDSKRKDWEVQLPAANADGKHSFYTDVCDLYKQQVQIVLKKAKSGNLDASDLFYGIELTSPSYVANAYNYPENNAIFVLSSQLMPPMFDASRSVFLNYGILGAGTIGHEITHGFDTTGKLYDKTGVKTEWMAAADGEAFDKLAAKLIAFFDTQLYGNGYKCNGTKTVGENIADLGGLNISYDAFLKQLDKQVITGAERDRQCREFFRAFAYKRMTNVSDKRTKMYESDEHAFPSLRINGNVYQLDEFYRLFHVKGGSRFIQPADRIVIW